MEYTHKTPDGTYSTVLYDDMLGEAAKRDCCDGTGWTGDPYERCAEHYEVPGFGASGLY